MKRRVLAATTMIALAGLLAAACGTPAPEPIQPNYSNAACGLSIWYPEDWIYEEGIDQIIFASSEDAITTYPPETGAFMLIVCGGLEDEFGFRVAIIVHTLGLATVRHEARTIGGQDGYVETVEFAAESGVEIAGFTAGAGDEDWGCFFVAAGAQDEWPEYQPVLMRMLDSAQFRAPARQTPGSMG